MVLQIISLLAVALSVAYCHSLARRQALDPTTLPDSVWPKAIVAVGYNKQVLEDFDLLATTLEAQLDVQLSTCVQFVDIDDLLPEDFAYAKLIFETGTYDRCLTPIGHQANAQQQPARISASFPTTEDVIHEVLHALGLVHTQNRPDARSYTTVNTTNVRVYDQAKFAPWENVTTYDIPYEYGSIMHYDDKQYAIQLSSRTLIAVEPLHQQTMGSRTGMSFYDVQLINKQYSCAAMCDNGVSSATCTNGGYPNPTSCYQCVCPRTYDDDCSKKHPATTEMKSDFDYQTLKVVYPGTAAVQDSWTFNDYWITTDPALLIEIVIEKQESPANHHFEKCLPGCSQGGIEIRSSNDKAATGYRFCCNSQFPITMNATGPILPVIFFNRYGGQTYSIKYRQVEDSTKCKTKYDLFSNTDATTIPTIVRSLFSACNSSKYIMDRVDRLSCDLLAYQLLDVMRSNLPVDEKFVKFKAMFTIFTDADLLESRANFTRTAIISRWGTFYQLLRCTVDSPPTTPSIKAKTTTTSSAGRTTAKTTVPVTTKQPTAPAATTKDPNDEFARCVAYITAWPEFVEDLRSGCFVRWNQSDTNLIHCVFFVFQLRSVQTSNQSVDAKLAGLQTVVSAYDRGIAKRREFLVSITSQRPEWSWIYARCMG